MQTTIAGIYKDGKVELLETPPGVREGRVRVALSEDSQATAAPHFLQYGKYAHGRLSTEDDFLSAEWHGGAEASDE